MLRKRAINEKTQIIKWNWINKYLIKIIRLIALRKILVRERMLKVRWKFWRVYWKKC
jgi:hypothetical protein